jgi:hypothetical protein
VGATSHADICGQTDRDERTDMSKLMGAFRDNSNAPKVTADFQNSSSFQRRWQPYGDALIPSASLYACHN